MDGKGISVVIPAFNAAHWLDDTVGRIVRALDKANIRQAEIIILDDGSSDNTYDTAKQLEATSTVPIVALTQSNQGRFITRKRGVETARYPVILFVDSRVWIDETSLQFVSSQLADNPDRIIWNGHVNVDKAGNIIARFGDAITYIGWRRYFSHPRLVSYGTADFDHYPKGTGFFLAPKSVLVEAIAWFETVTTNIKESSDDTLLIRHIAETHRIWLSPEFSCTYHARTTIRAFAKHSYNRGKFFVDGFLRPGTRFFVPLLLFLTVCIAVLAVIVFKPAVIIYLVLAASLLWLIELAAALLLGLAIRDALSLFVLSPLFAVMYGIGIWRAVIRRVIA